MNFEVGVDAEAFAANLARERPQMSMVATVEGQLGTARERLEADLAEQRIDRGTGSVAGNGAGFDVILSLGELVVRSSALLFRLAVGFGTSEMPNLVGI